MRGFASRGIMKGFKLTEDMIRVVNRYMEENDDWYDGVNALVRDLNEALSRRNIPRTGTYRKSDFKTFIIGTHEMVDVLAKLQFNYSEKMHKII